MSYIFFHMLLSEPSLIWAVMMIGSHAGKQAHFKQLIHPIAPPVPIVLPPAKGMTLTMMGVG